MLIIPKCLTTSHSVTDTEELTLGFIESLAKESAPCLLVRSKPLQSKMLLQKWKKGEFQRVRYGLIYARFLGHSFLEKWTFFLADSRANHLAVPESEVETKIQDTCSHTSSVESKSANQALCSSKMSRELYQPNLLEMDGETPPERRFCSMSYENWNELVTERRGAYSARLKSARRISASGSSSWPTIRASEYKDVGPVGSKSHDHMLGKHYLCAVVTQEEAHGQAAPASSSTIGSRQGLWLTPKVGDNHATKHHPQRSDGGQPNLAFQIERQDQWRTPTSFDWKNTDCSTQVYLSDQVEGRTEKQADFPTPRTCDWKSSPNADSNIKRMDNGQATLSEFVHAKHKKGDLWSTPRTGATESSRPNNKGGIPLADQAKRESAWATPTTCNAPEAVNWETFNGQYFRKTDGRKHQTDLSLQVKGWATPQAKDHKSGHRDASIVQYKQLNVEAEAKASGKLNPRWVETLMGLPVGWVMPNCVSPVTIEPMNCDCLEMESFQPPQNEPSES